MHAYNINLHANFCKHVHGSIWPNCMNAQWKHLACMCILHLYCMCIIALILHVYHCTYIACVSLHLFCIHFIDIMWAVAYMFMHTCCTCPTCMQHACACISPLIFILAVFCIYRIVFVFEIHVLNNIWYNIIQIHNKYTLYNIYVQQWLSPDKYKSHSGNRGSWGEAPFNDLLAPEHALLITVLMVSGLMSPTSPKVLNNISASKN